MPIGSAVHARTLPLCESLNYREWSGFYAVSSYEAHHEHEYNAIRNASALIDVSPLFKYRLSGRDAVKLVDRVITRDAFKLAVGQVYYTPWCDEHGKVIDDGTVTRLSEDTFRWTAADPSLRWFTQNAIGLDVAIEDISEQVAALALQGPTSGRLLDAVADADIRGLKYFRMTRGTIVGVPVEISRTGYTGDLGYEIWMPWDRAVEVWDALMTGGRPFDIHAAGMLALDVAIEDISEQVAALALQGPTSGRLLAAVADADMGGLKYFRMTRGTIAGVPIEISRTGYTGDLGYEIWMPWDRAVDVWDALMKGGRAFDIHAAGMLALDVARVEAGLLLIDVDFFSSKKALIASQKYSPFEMGLGRLVQLDARPFVGRSALIDEKRRGPSQQIVGLEISWPAVEALYDRLGLAPQIAATASRTPVPVYRGGRQVGRATTTTWSPVMKKLIALATVSAPHVAAGTALEFEVTVEAVRHRVPATVVHTPFFSPSRKTAPIA